jgi:phosphoribosylformylglycinamidine synthase subunit PurQ / glutaminase
MQIAIIQFPGSNCERETMLAVKRAGMQPIEFLWNGPAEKLAEFKGFIIVGGFSYEDRVRAGVIAALDPILQTLKIENKKGKPILGICNGAQILVESGLIPGLEQDQLGMALTDNKRVQQGKVLGTGYYNAWITLRLSDDYQLNAFTRHLTPHHILKVPIAHAEGRFIVPPALLNEMKNNGQCLFQYCDEQGNIIDEFPINPNGSINNIAAVSNKAGNVMAMMPHPERTTQGDAIFQSMRDYIHDYIKNAHVPAVAPLYYQPRREEKRPYVVLKNAYEFIVDLIITDNHALSVEKALERSGMPAKIKRRTHWEIECDSQEVFEKIKSSGVLYNDRKEKIIASTEIKNASNALIKNASNALIKNASNALLLVHAKSDMIGRQKYQMLKNHFGISGVHAIRHSILWQIGASSQTTIDHIINSLILYNPYAHDCYYY